MSDPPQQTSRHDSSEEQLVRLVPERELDRLQARQEHLTEAVEDLEAENRMLRLEVATLKRKLDQKDRQRQQIIDNYERILAEKERKQETVSTRTGTNQSRLADVLLGRSETE